MAGYGYSYGSQSPYDGFDPWKGERSRNSEELCRPALDESEGRRVITGGPYQYPGTYVMKVETTVERVHPAMLSEHYRQCSPPRYDHRPCYGEVNNKLHGPSIPSNDQNEVSQPSGLGAPWGTYQHRIPVSAGYSGSTPYKLRIPVSGGYYGTTGNAGDSDHEKERPITNTIKEEDLEVDKILKPPATVEGVHWPRPGYPSGFVLPSHPISYEREPTIQLPSVNTTGRPERRGPNMELSKPINDIGTAMEYLKKAADPSCVNTIKDEAPNHSHFKGHKIPKPPVATEGGPPARPGHPTGSPPPNYYIPSKRGERTMTGGWERRGHDMGPELMNETGKAVEYPKEAVRPPPVGTVPKRDSNPETIDSNEARRRYGNLNPAPEQHKTGYASTIDSREAVRRYNGQFV
ncbi:uncharacterized protein J3R85_020410 [Psidium guajava]|nr:uncharacterized protein J3R85_020410 [Psidium guajava]